jgi:small-conductance mechanosensitive channel
MRAIALIFVILLPILGQNNTTEFNIEDRSQKIQELLTNIDQVDNQLNSNVWYTKYYNHKLYIDFQKEYKKLEYKISLLKRKRKSIPENLRQKRVSLEHNMQLISEFKSSPFETILNPKILEKEPTIKSPFDIISAFSYLKTIQSTQDRIRQEVDSLGFIISLLESKVIYLKELDRVTMTTTNQKDIQDLSTTINSITISYNQAEKTFNLFLKKTDDDKLRIKKDIYTQAKKLFNTIIMILVIVIISFILKLIVKKTIVDNERYYMANKIINFSNLVIIIIILLFSFLENVSYLVTVIGFASAGIAIAMKDLFMSTLGWIVIVFGGSFHVGDRVKVTKDGIEYVGDIVDISFLRITILEDVTLTTYMINKRAGRIIFIPNNYIFTELLANYTHGKIKTVWDGIEITLTFDSNYKKATHNIKEIVKKYSKGYTDISRRQLNQLRNQYNLKNINVDPRIYTFLEPNGVRISCWYMTNSYATLTLRSNIFANILNMVNQEDDIKIAFPTQVVNIKRDMPLSPQESYEEE